MLKYLPFLLLLTLIACDDNSAARKAARGANFVPDPNHIYFKNVRAFRYRTTEVTNRATLYDHRELYDSDARLVVQLVDNWIQDRALLRFSARPNLPLWRLLADKQDRRDTLALSNPPTNDELVNLVRVLRSPTPLLLVTETDTLEAFPAGSGRTAARAVIRDYLRLVEYAE